MRHFVIVMEFLLSDWTQATCIIITRKQNNPPTLDLRRLQLHSNLNWPRLRPIPLTTLLILLRILCLHFPRRLMHLRDLGSTHLSKQHLNMVNIGAAFVEEEAITIAGIEGQKIGRNRNMPYPAVHRGYSSKPNWEGDLSTTLKRMKVFGKFHRRY